MTVEMGQHKEKDPQGRKLVIFVGPEGSGKSTQGKLLAGQLDKPYISTGDMIRDRAANDPGQLGEACRAMIAAHAYLDAKLLSQLLVHRLSKSDTRDGAVIDGALRTLEETEDFDQTLVKAGKEGFEVDVIFLDLDPEIGIQRRLSAPVLRKEETRETIKKRLEKFYTNLDERMEIVKQRYNFFKIDASKTEPEVHEKINEALNEDE